MTAQTHVAETDDLWRLTMEHSPVGMAIVSLAGAFLTVNAALCDMLGYEPDVLATLDFQSITHPDDSRATCGCSTRPSRVTSAPTGSPSATSAPTAPS